MRNAALSKALRDFDKGLVSQLNRLTKSINSSCEKVEIRLRKVKSNVIILLSFYG
jgi:hypothetical protein